MSRKRRVFSVQRELLLKSREAALAAVQIFNNPQILFKSELFIVAMNIAWTYLLHAHYRKSKVDYRYSRTENGRKRFERTKAGACKHWELERCLNCADSPIDGIAAHNLRFLIGIRHEIEHQMTSRIDQALSAKFQACCLNYNHYIKKLFGDSFAIDKHLAFSLQFAAIDKDQTEMLSAFEDLPRNIQGFIKRFESDLTKEEYESPVFAYRVLFVHKTANRKGQADEVIEFVKAESQLGQTVSKSYAVIKETERPKHIPSSIVKRMRDEGYTWFGMHKHTELWQTEDAKADGKGFGVKVAKTWYWYDTWADFVESYCRKRGKGQTPLEM